MSVLWPSLNGTPAGQHTRNLFDIPLPANTGAELIKDSVMPAEVTGDGLVVELPRVIAQAANSLWPGVNDTFYNRILIEPSQLDMGNLLSSQTRTIRVWNGFFVNKNLQSFQRNNDTGITVIEPVAVPYVMRPLEQLNYILNITTDGPATITASYDWVVDGETYSANVTGRRVVVWPFGPSWDTPVTESLEWLTDVLRSFDGSEQRRGLRTKARRSFSYMFKTARTESARVENLLWGWQNRIYALPVWTDRSKLTQSANQGESVINLSTDTYSFTEGGLAVIYGDTLNFEIVEIQAIEPTSITTVRPLEGPWSSGSKVMPVLLGHLPTNTPLIRRSSQALLGTLTFQTDPVNTDPYTPTTVAPVIYNGREVIMRQPNWKNALNGNFEYLFDTLDQQTGAITWDTTEEFPRITRSYTWLLSNRQQISDFRSMLGRRSGMRNSMYVPSWHDDFVVTRVIGAADIGISVLRNEFRLMVGSNPARDRLMIRLKDGTYYFRKITGVSDDGTYTLLTIDEALGVEVEVGQVASVHVLMCSRLATDKVDIIWRTGQAAEVDTTIISVLE